jgi:hypothetical protein
LYGQRKDLVETWARKIGDLSLFVVAKMICWNFWVLRVLVPSLDGNQRRTRAGKVRKVLFAEKRKERPHGVMQRDPVVP